MHTRTQCHEQKSSTSQNVYVSKLVQTHCVNRKHLFHSYVSTVRSYIEGYWYKLNEMSVYLNCVNIDINTFVPTLFSY